MASPAPCFALLFPILHMTAFTGRLGPGLSLWAARGGTGSVAGWTSALC